MFNSRHNVLKSLIILFLGLASKTWAAPIITLPLQKEEINLLEYIDILEDPGEDLTLVDVISKNYSDKFSSAKTRGLNIGFTHSAYWVRFSVKKNKLHIPPTVLILHFANTNRADFYQLSAKGTVIKRIRTGNLRPLNTKDVLNPNIIFTISIPGKEINTFYLRIQNDATTNLTMSMTTADKYIKISRSNNFLMGLFIGIMLILIGYNLTLAYSFKNKTYFYFIFSIIFFTLYTLSFKGYAYLYLWPHSPELNLLSLEISLSLLIISFLLFTDNFLSVKKYFPRTHIILGILAGAALILFVLSFIMEFQIVIRAINFVIITSFIIVLSLSYLSWHKKYTSAYFLSSLLFFFVMTLMTMLVVFGIIQSRFFTDNSYILGSFPPILLMSLALANQVKSLKSDKEKTEQELSASLEKFKAIIDYSNDIFWEADKNSFFRYLSPNVQKVSGWSTEEMIGKRAFDYLKPKEVERMMKTLKTSALTNTPVLGHEYEMRNKNNEWIILEKNAKPFYNKDGKLLGFRGNDRDITLHYRQKKILQESEEKFKAIVENTQTAITMINNKYTIIYANPRFEKLTGYPLDELNGTDFRKYVNPVIAEMVSKRYKIRQDGKKVPESYEIEIINKKGIVIPVKIFVNVVKDYNHKTITIAQIIDLTEQKHLENQLITSQKMEAIGTLAGGIAHDFNNLLTVIKGYSEVLLMRLKESDQRRKHIETILSASQKAESLTKQILAFSRKQIYQPQIVDINKLLSNFIKMASRLIGEDIHIETYLSENLPRIKADPGQIEQIVINILVNARDAINELKNIKEKKITIRTQIINKDNHSVLMSAEAQYNEYIEVSIADTGIGMSDDIKKKIFEPFFTTKEKNKSTGLGLATAYGIITQNEGFIDIESKLYKGSVFKIYWPVKNSNDKKLEKD